jgi:hypothetical protein
METMTGSGGGFARRLTGGAALIALMVWTAGCSKNPAQSGTPAGGTGGPAPIAKPGAKIGENNPPAGQPNHMSPEMQAQLQHYQSMGNQK